MGRSKQSKQSKGANIFNGKKAASECSVHSSQSVIDGHWNQMPPEAKGFISKAMNENPYGLIKLGDLLKFWMSPKMINCLNCGLVEQLCITSWFLTLIYVEAEALNAARALMVNGAFLHQCLNTGVSSMFALYKSNPPAEVLEEKMPYFVAGLRTCTQSPLAGGLMKTYINTFLPKEYQQMKTRLASRNSSNGIMNYVNEISNYWDGSTKSSHKNVPQKQITDEGSPIQIVFLDNASEGNNHSIDTKSSNTLVALITDYAEKRGGTDGKKVSLRKLRFSHKDSTLFLSSSGKKTLGELGMQDGDIIIVHETSESQVTSAGGGMPECKKSKPKKKNRQRKNKSRGKSKPSKQEDQLKGGIKEEDLKIEHSKMLGKVHEEMQPRLKQIRQRLNNLAIKRSQPKKKSAHNNSKETVSALSCSVVGQSPATGLGGKAGRSAFVVQVGEVENLHKTSKPSSGATHPARSGGMVPALDLHGRSRDEALTMLEDGLEAWVDAAMRGEYPFVVQATIVCGCGNQVLSEVVQEWIKSKRNVCNAHKRG